MFHPKVHAKYAKICPNILWVMIEPIYMYVYARNNVYIKGSSLVFRIGVI